jgi:hypothetical protein
MKKFIYQLLIIVLICMGVLLGLEKFYDFEFTKNPLFGIDNNRSTHYDYVVLGNSRVGGVYSSIVDSLTGLNGITISNPGANLGDLRMTLEYFLERGNTTKYLFMAVDPPAGSRDYSRKKYLFIPYNQRFGLAGIHFPFVKYATYNKNYAIKNLWKAINGKWNRLRKPNPDKQGFVRWDFLFQDHSIREFHDEYLVDLRMFCLAKDINLVLFTPPYTPEYLSIQSEFDKYQHEIEAIEIEFHDFSAFFNDNSYFVDDMHLGYNGELLFSREVAKMIDQAVK